MLTEPAPGISASASEENQRYFNVMILGPQSSPYDGANRDYHALIDIHRDSAIFYLSTYLHSLPAICWGASASAFAGVVTLPSEHLRYGGLAIRGVVLYRSVSCCH